MYNLFICRIVYFWYKHKCKTMIICINNNISKFIKTGTCIFPLVATYGCGPNANKEKLMTESPCPNILFFITDDMEPYMFNYLEEGRGKNLTPNLDRLVDEGVIMMGQYVSSPVSTPSRYSCLTGQYASRSNHEGFLKDTREYDGETVVQWNSYINPGETTIGSLLQNLGYITGFYGKNHVIEAPGWEKLPLDSDPLNTDVKTRLLKNSQIIRESIQKCGFDYAGANYQDNPHYLGPEALRTQNLDWVTEAGLHFLDSVGDSPFFLCFATTVPHGPNDAAHSWNGDRRITPEGIIEKTPEVLPPADSIAGRIKRSGLDKNGKIPDDIANVLWMDDALGALIKKLEETGKLQNTIIFFFNDNGQYAKGSVYQGGVSSPSVIWRAEGFKSRKINHLLVSNIDFAPTIFEMAGGSPDTISSFDGKSFLQALNGSQEPIHESLYFEMGFSRAVLKDSVKYIALRYPDYAINWNMQTRKKKLDEWNSFRRSNKLKYHYTDPSLPFSHLMLIPGGGDAEYPSTKRYRHYYDKDQLYDLRNDPNEQVNLIDDPAWQSRKIEMQAVLKEYLEKLPGSFGEFKVLR